MFRCVLLRSLEVFRGHVCSSVEPFGLQLFLFDIILASMADAEGKDNERLKADPSITVADLEGCLERYFKKMTCRNLQDEVNLVKESRSTWNSAAKAILCKARLIGFDLIVGVFSLLSFRRPPFPNTAHTFLGDTKPHQTTHIYMYIYIYISTPDI